MRCFCGCGRKVPRAARAVSRRGERIAEDVGTVRDLIDRGMRSANGAEFVRDGERMCETLAETIHAGGAPGREVEYESLGFMAFGHAKFSQHALGAAVQRSGMPVGDAVAALARGTWDPYADVEMEY